MASTNSNFETVQTHHQNDQISLLKLEQEQETNNQKALRTRLKRQHGGVNLADSGLSILIGLSLLAVAFVVFKSVSGSKSASELTEGLSAIVTAASKLYAVNPDTTGLDTTFAIKAGIVPDALKVNATTARNPMGGYLLVAADPTNISLYTVTIDNIPPKVCNDVIASSASIFYTVKVGSTVVKDVTETKPTTANIVNGCASDDTMKTIVFTGKI